MIETSYLRKLPLIFSNNTTPKDNYYSSPVKNTIPFCTITVHELYLRAGRTQLILLDVRGKNLWMASLRGDDANIKTVYEDIQGVPV